MPRGAGDADLAGDYAHAVRAEIALRSGALPQALREIRQVHFNARAAAMSNTLHAGARERFVRAELLRAAGAEAEALRWYASFPEPSGYDIAYLAPAALREGEIEERRGHRAEAIAHFERVVRLWKDADPGLRSTVSAARASLTRLQKAGS
jgi:tetratricopeptide (TPR) repeat protein